MDEIKQNTSNWLEWRRGGLGSSDSVILCGLSPWRTIQDLWNDKVFGSAEQKESYPMLRGRALEPIARDLYNFEYGIEMEECIFIHPEYKFMRASADGFNHDAGFGIEIKCPGKKDLELAKQGKIPTKYFAQLQWLMLCSASQWIDYVSYPGKDTIDVVRVYANPKYQRKMIKLARWFWRQVEMKKEIKRAPKPLIPTDPVCA